MKKNELFCAYGTDYTAMTVRLLKRAGLYEAIREKVPEGPVRIGIKPNLVVSSPAFTGATTHPEVVAGILEYLREYGFTEPVILEGSWVGDSTADAFEYCGYNALAKNYGVRLIDCPKELSEPRDCGGMTIRTVSCLRSLDFLINVPVLKGHCQTQMTCALKNWKGLIPNSEKRRFHTLGLHKPIACLNTAIPQDFIVVDHICGDPSFEEGGNPLVRSCVMAARDPVLTDAYASLLLGLEPREVEYVRLAEAYGVGSAELSALKRIVTEGDGSADVPDTRRLLSVSYAVEDIDSCSACYAGLVDALERLSAEGNVLPEGMKIGIGQGWRGKSGAFGVGACTADFLKSVPGCPPEEGDIYAALKQLCSSKEGGLR